MAYTPPVGTADLALTGTYTPPAGTVNLDLGATASPESTAIIAGETLAPTGTLAGLHGSLGTLAGETLAPTGTLLAFQISRVLIAGETLAPTGAVTAAYDPNLLSDIVRSTQEGWQDAIGMPQATQEAFQDAPGLPMGLYPPWREAALQSTPQRAGWQDSPVLMDGKRPAWTEALPLRAGPFTAWLDSPRLDRSAASRWQEGQTVTRSVASLYHSQLPRPEAMARPDWQDGIILTVNARDGMQDGWRVIAVEIEVWKQAGYPWNATNPGPSIPPVIRWPWGSNLDLRCPLPTSPGRIHLNLGRSPCILVAEREIPYRRSYMTTNSASLVRWPDLVPLPVTAMTLETDFDSWCWALTATLAGPEAWALVQPNPLACEVQATINGQVWRFLLDVPSQSRSFNQDRVTLKGRSRSAWLHDPYTPSRSFTQSQARDMTQLAALAVENTGWSVDWQLEDWLVPAGRYNSWNTPIGALIRLANTTDDGVYTHPTDQVITLHKRWPVASWLLDGETMDVLIPESAILSLTQSPVYSQPLNGVYVSGISHGALALVKITGTDGALQPDEPVTDELLCDEAGVAARQRGLNALSDSGAGWEMDAETLFNPTATPAFPLVPPGQIVSIAGLKGISRSCRITAQRSGHALSVRQSIGLERREAEAENA